MQSRTIILMTLLSVFYAVSALALDDKLKFTASYPSSEGVVHFDHEAHSFGRVKDCAFCHSALKTFGGQMNELFAHNFCKTCHESHDGPVDCAGCHTDEQKK